MNSIIFWLGIWFMGCLISSIAFKFFGAPTNGNECRHRSCGDRKGDHCSNFLLAIYLWPVFIVLLFPVLLADSVPSLEEIRLKRKEEKVRQKELAHKSLESMVEELEFGTGVRG